MRAICSIKQMDGVLFGYLENVCMVLDIPGAFIHVIDLIDMHLMKFLNSDHWSHLANLVNHMYNPEGKAIRMEQHQLFISGCTCSVQDTLSTKSRNIQQSLNPA